MSTGKWTTGYEAGFFWTGVVMTIATVALVFAGNTELVYHLERTSFPLSWAFGGIAICEFVAAEFCHEASIRDSRKNLRSIVESEPADTWEGDTDFGQ